MAKKFVDVVGLHNVFDASGSQLNTSTIKESARNEADDYSILFITADSTDITYGYDSGSRWIWANGKLYNGNDRDFIISITYSELKQLRDNGRLIPGRQYRITDYKTTCTTSTYTDSNYLFRFDCRVADTVGYTYNYFDIIVTADTNNTLNENARACSPSSTSASTDSKYTSQKFSKWRLKYSIDNDTSTYRWATSNGKGVIYYMEDEWGNTSCYDFKNIVMRPYMIDHTKINNHNIANNYYGTGNPQTIFTKTTKYLYTFGVIDKFSSCTNSLSTNTIITADGTLSGSTHRYSNCKNDSLYRVGGATYCYIPMNFMITSLTYHTSSSGSYNSSIGCWDTDFRNSTSCSMIALYSCRNTSITGSQNIDLYSLEIEDNIISTTIRVSIITQNEYMASGWIFKISMQGAGGYSTLCCNNHFKDLTMTGNISRGIRIYAGSIQCNEFINSTNILIDANANSKEPTTSKVGVVLYNSFSYATNITIKSGNVLSNRFNAGDYYATLTTPNTNSFKNPWRNYFFYGANYGTSDNFKEISLPSGEVNTNVVGKNVQYIQID